jgi:hypothetical protein
VSQIFVLAGFVHLGLGHSEGFGLVASRVAALAAPAAAKSHLFSDGTAHLGLVTVC